MKIFRINTLNDLKNGGIQKKSVSCIGYFDGLHQGHQALINKTLNLAKKHDLVSRLITFDPDPWTVIKGNHDVNHITPLDEKLRLLEMYHIEEVVIIHFNANLSRLEPAEFVEKLLIPLGTQALVCGRDYRFGFKGAGNTDYLQEHYSDVMPTHIVDILNDSDGKVGTTQIVQKILKGQMESVAVDLKRNYCITGRVIHGQKQGRTIGFPTANLEVDKEYVMPKPGVYAGYVRFNEVVYRSIINIGYNPTFNTVKKLSIETHILDFNEEIYGMQLTQSFSHRIRDELHFDSIDALIVQMKADEQFARTNLDLNEDYVIF